MSAKERHWPLRDRNSIIKLGNSPIPKEWVFHSQVSTAMGLERTIRFRGDAVPTWEAIRGQLHGLGVSPVVRLIDGLPAFPDEVPPSDWKELRIALSAGMVTIRRDRGSLTCVIWGNADASLGKDWQSVVVACAAAGGGLIDGPEGPETAEQFTRSSGRSPE
jgi:hypothetical protein